MIENLARRRISTGQENIFISKIATIFFSHNSKIKLNDDFYFVKYF